MPSPERIVAARVELTPLTVADADEMVAVLAGDELYTFIGGTSPTLPQLRARYQRLVVGRSADGAQEWHNWIVRARPDGPAVGTVQATITEDGRAAEIAWVIGLGSQRQGFATEAATAVVSWLDRHGVARITAHVHPDHLASNAVARRLGLQPTGDVVDGERRWRRDLSSSSAGG